MLDSIVPLIVSGPVAAPSEAIARMSQAQAQRQEWTRVNLHRSVAWPRLGGLRT